MKAGKKIFGIILCGVLTFASTFGQATVCFGGQNPSPTRVLAYVKPGISVQLGETMQIFKDEKGERLYPIIYKGTAYLPVRAMSEIMQENIEWDGYSRTVYIGKTLTNPQKAEKDDSEKKYVQSVAADKYQVPDIATASVTISIRPEVTVMYDFQIQEFRDSVKSRIYPVFYNGSIYLPIRSIAELMGEKISWDNANKLIYISTENADAVKKEQAAEEAKKKKEQEKENYKKIIPETTIKLKKIYEESLDLYNQANRKMVNISNIKDLEQRKMIAASVSQDLLLSQQQIAVIKDMKAEQLTDEEKEAQKAVEAFAETSEYYILVLENIAVLAAEGRDYSMLSDTFLEFAVESQKKMQEAKKAVDALEK